MKLILCTLAAACICLATAQTPPRFYPATPNNLQVKFTEPAPLAIFPGRHVSELKTKFPPAILPPPDSSPQDLFFLIMLDIDIPLTANLSVPGLHWMAQNLEPNNTCDSKNLTTTSQAQSIIAPYLSPNPEFNSGFHTYTISLFKQPENFTFPQAYAYLDPPSSVKYRIGFNTTKFVDVAGLGQPIAATWWLEKNGTANGNATETDPDAFGSRRV